MALGGVQRRVAAALAVLALAAAWDGYRLVTAARWNSAIASGEAVEAAEDAPPEARFAKAWRLAQGEDPTPALPVYKQLESDPEWSTAARYNAANVYFRLALETRAEEGPSLALPYVELAKRTYRETLRNDPGLWDARYNLERLLRLAPEGEDDTAEGGPPPLPAERAVTTMQGVTLGLP